MRLFRPKYKDRNGKTKTVKKWWVELRDHLHIVRRFPGFTDKGQTELLGRQIERVVNYRVAGEQPDAQLARWLEQVPARLKDRFVSIGLLESTRAAAAKPLKEHLEDFRKSLGGTTKRAKHTVNGIVRMFGACKFGTWSDISASRLMNHLTDLKTKGDFSERTFNFYLKASKQFARWMVKDRRATVSPLERLDCETVTNRRRERRALEPDEIRRLLEATAAGPVRYSMDGRERSLLYRVACGTGLRASEIRGLKVSSFDFGKLTVAATQTKNKKPAVLPLRPSTAAELQSFFTGRLPNVKAFGGTYEKLTDRTADMLKADLAAANIAYVDDSGRYFDFHALRGECASLLAASGVHPKAAQTILRHSDVNLTMNSYTHTLRGQEAKAIASLPDLSLPSSEKQEPERPAQTATWRKTWRFLAASIRQLWMTVEHTPRIMKRKPHFPMGDTGIEPVTR